MAQDYDLLLKGGHVIDGKNKISAVRDVAIKDGKIAEVAASIDPAKAHKVVNVARALRDAGTGRYPRSRLRRHRAARRVFGDNSVYPDGFTFRSGVTTVVDAGSSGWRNFPDFKDRVIDRSKTRVLALLNIVGNGMGGEADRAGRERHGREGHRGSGQEVQGHRWWASRPRISPARSGSRSSARWKPARWRTFR